MLIDEPAVLESNPILDIISGGRKPTHLQTGCYQIGHFGSSHFLRDQGFIDAKSYDPVTFAPLLSVGDYGVCDNLENLLAKCPELQFEPERQFVVTLTRISKSEEPTEGGWRWHKWGEYIGTQTPTTEYIADEPKIDTVYCYHIYEKEHPHGPQSSNHHGQPAASNTVQTGH